MHYFARYRALSILVWYGVVAVSYSSWAADPSMVLDEDFDLIPEHSYRSAEQTTEPPQSAAAARTPLVPRLPSGTIGEITVTGNLSVPTYTILSKIPYHVGDLITSAKTRLAIKNIYSLGMVSCVQIAAEPLDATGHGPRKRLRLIISVTEKRPIARIVLEGARVLTPKFIAKKLDLGAIVALDEGDFYSLEQRIKKLYVEKNYHHVLCTSRFELTPCDETEVKIHITEGKPTHIRRVHIQGNTIVSAAQIKKILVTRENWLLGFMDHSGSYQEGMLEYDRHMIEEFYQNRGYIAAQVADPVITPVPGSADIDVTFVIDEGEQYRVSSVSAQEHKLLSEAEQLAIIPIRPGHIFSREAVRASLETLRMIVGEYGYINAEVSPRIIPDPATRQVAIEFVTTLGTTMSLHRINIVGNARTDDNVIRRVITLNEGELITTQQMEISKNRVQALGFFEPRGGVNWNIVRRDEENADLELILKEIKTGSFMFNLGVNGDVSDTTAVWKKVKAGLGAQNTNWFGRGIQGNVSASYSAQQSGIDLTIADPWLFDRPIYGSITAYHHRSDAEDKFTPNAPPELSTAVFGKIGLNIAQLSNVSVTGDIGFEHICFPPLTPELIAQLKSLSEITYNVTARKRLSGNIISLGATIIQDLRNHPVYPTDGYLLNGTLKVAVPHSLTQQETLAQNTSLLQNTSFSFVKGEFDGQWYAPVINEYDIVFRLHLFVGAIHQIGRYIVPFRELYHIGGPGTVRGFTYGQIGSSFRDNLLGSTRALVVNAELLFPIKVDASIRGVLFYDGGSGWGTSNADLIPVQDRLALRDHFDYRHAIGFGIRLTSPMPVSIDVGFKLDRRKRLGESLSEVHFNMTRDF